MRLFKIPKIRQTLRLLRLSSVAALLLVFISACGAGDVNLTGGGVFADSAPATAPAAPAAPMAPVATPHPPGSTMVQEEAIDDWDAAAPAYSVADILWSDDAAANHLRHTAILDRMIIRNAFISMETERFEWAVFEIERIVDVYGGFIESSGRHTIWTPEGEFWRADYTLRVPVDHFDLANRDIMALAAVINFSTSSEDVTMHFQDLDSRLRIREEEERRILSMIENATELEDLIRLESRLSNVRLTLERYRRRMAEIDHLASFATIHLSLTEVESEDAVAALTADTFFTRISDAFGGSLEISLIILEGLVMFIAVIILPLTILAVPVLLGFFVIRRMLRYANSNLR